MAHCYSSLLESGTPQILHGDVVDHLIQRKSAVNGHEYEVCPKGCKLYGLTDNQLCCPHCQEPRYKDALNLVPRSSMKIMSIGDILAQMLADDQTRELLGYRANRQVQPGTITDVFDGKNYTDLLSKGYFRNSHDIAVGLFTDGFVNQHKGKSSYTIVHVIIYNFDPSIRYFTH